MPAIRGFGEQLDEPSGVERLHKKLSDTKGSKVSATIHTAVADYARLPLKLIELLHKSVRGTPIHRVIKQDDTDFAVFVELPERLRVCGGSKARTSRRA